MVAEFCPLVCVTLGHGPARRGGLLSGFGKGVCGYRRFVIPHVRRDGTRDWAWAAMTSPGETCWRTHVLPADDASSDGFGPNLSPDPADTITQRNPAPLLQSNNYTEYIQPKKKKEGMQYVAKFVALVARPDLTHSMLMQYPSKQVVRVRFVCLGLSWLRKAYATDKKLDPVVGLVWQKKESVGVPYAASTCISFVLYMNYAWYYSRAYYLV